MGRRRRNPHITVLAKPFAMKRIAYIVDSLDWIQAQRAKDLQPWMVEPDEETGETYSADVLEVEPKYALEVHTVGWLLDRCRREKAVRERFDAVWLASWRLLCARRELADILPWGRTMASVTSHYQIGGGLRTESCFRKGTDPAQEFAKAIEILRRFRLVTCNSRLLYDLLHPHLPAVALAQNGVDEAEFSDDQREGGYNRESILFGWCGKLKAAKNFSAFQQAADQLTHGDFPPFRFRAVVAPRKRHSIFRKSGLEECFTSQLSRDGMRQFYEALDFYVCTSFHEGTPNPALEAAACGVPIITTRVGNTVEGLVREGETGWFIDPTAESLIACVERLQHLEPHEYRRMSHNVRLVIEAEWTWEIRAEAYRKALETLCG